MIVDDVVAAVVAALEGDAALVGLLGGKRIYRMGSNHEPEVPSVEYLIASDTPRETTEPILIQFDIWTNGFVAAGQVGSRLNAVLHAEGVHALGGLKMYARREAGPRDHGDPDPHVVHRSMDFRFEPARG